MSKKCAITGKSTLNGGGYSNRIRATEFNPTGKRRRKANIQKKRIFVPEINKTVNIQVSASGLRKMAKNGIYETLIKAGVLKRKTAKKAA